MTDAHRGVNEQHDDLVERLEAFGRNPVSPAVQSAHLTAMSGAVAAPGNRKWFARLRVAGALMVGFLAGSTGLAAAGVQAGVATAPGEAIAKAAGVELEGDTVTHGTERYFGATDSGQTCQQLAGLEGTAAAKNRGQFLKLVRENNPDALEAAKDSKCGMPLTADQAEAEEQQAEKAANANKAKGKSNGKGKGGDDGDVESTESEANEASDAKSENRSDVAEDCAEGPDPAVAEDPATAGEAAQDIREDNAECGDNAGDAADNDNAEAGKAKAAENKAAAEDRADAGAENKPEDLPAAPAGS